MNVADAGLAGDLLRSFAGQPLTDADRPIRLRLAGRHGPLEGVLLVQRLDIAERLCEGLTGHLTCLSTRVDLPLQTFIGLPVEVQLVTDRGGLRRICMIVTEARAGQSDGGLATFQLTGRDAFALLQRRVNSRIFLDRSVIDIARIVLDEHCRRLPALARCFEYDFLALDESAYPRRACTFQLDESDADFLRGCCGSRDCPGFSGPSSQRTATRLRGTGSSSSRRACGCPRTRRAACGTTGSTAWADATRSTSGRRCDGS